MRNALLSTAGWAGVLQAVTNVTPFTETWARLIGIAGVLGTLTLLVYRLGVWRQEMEHTKHNVVGGVKAYRDDTHRAQLLICNHNPLSGEPGRCLLAVGDRVGDLERLIPT